MRTRVDYSILLCVVYIHIQTYIYTLAICTDIYTHTYIHKTLNGNEVAYLLSLNISRSSRIYQIRHF